MPRITKVTYETHGTVLEYLTCRVLKEGIKRVRTALSGSVTTRGTC
jgi:hypothetical protein